MKTIAFDIKPTSAWVGTMESDVLFGRFCWAFCEAQGEEKLLGFLQKYKQQPFVLFSHAFPAGFLPRPILPPSQGDKKRSLQDYMNIRKEIKRLSFLLHSDLDSICRSLDSQDYRDLIWTSVEKNSCSGLISKTITTYKNSINRLSGRVEEGALFGQEEIWFGVDSVLRLYAKYDDSLLDRELLVKLVKEIGATGFGKEKSSGKGRFDIVKSTDNPTELSVIEDANCVLSLSNAVPCNAVRLFSGQTKLKFARHGGIPAVQGRYLKNPFQCFVPGCVFDIEEVKDCYGKGLSGLSKVQPNAIQGTLLFPYFMKREVR